MSEAIPHRSRFGPVSWRWLVLAVFPLGYLGTAPVLHYYRGQLLAWTVVATIACALLLTRKRTLKISTWPSWILLGAFMLGYYLKFYVFVPLAAAPTLPVFFVIPSQQLNQFADPRIAMDAFRLTTIGFTVYCLTYFLLLRNVDQGESSYRRVRRKDIQYVVRVAIIGSLILLGGTTAIAVVMNALGAGIEAEQHGFRILGWVFYSRAVLLVVLMLLVLQAALVTGSRRWLHWAVGLLSALALSELLIRSTRASIVTTAIAAFLMYSIVKDRIDRKAVLYFLALFAVALFMFPVVTHYRSLRIMEEAVGLDVLARAFTLALENTSAVDSMLFGTAAVLTRFIGIDSVVSLTNEQTWLGFRGFLTYHSSTGPMSHYFTRVVMGVPDDVVHSDAPSLLGWFLITGGVWGLTLGFAAYLTFGWLLWMWIWNSNLLVKPLAQVQFLLLWLLLSSEGTLDGLNFWIAALVTSLVACELFLRHERRRSVAIDRRRAARAAAVPSARPVL
jgi:hypothetical protein